MLELIGRSAVERTQHFVNDGIIGYLMKFGGQRSVQQIPDGLPFFIRKMERRVSGCAGRNRDGGGHTLTYRRI
jgi:hypothetical protein